MVRIERILWRFFKRLFFIRIFEYSFCLSFSRFLYELQLHHKETKMTVENLAVVFAPNFLRPQVRLFDFFFFFGRLYIMLQGNGKMSLIKITSDI